jgi:hypothetical protein
VLKTRTRTAALAALLCAALVMSAGCSAGGGTGSTAGPTPAPSGARSAAGGWTWIVSGTTLTRLLALGGAGPATAAKEFDTPKAYVLTSAQDWSIPTGWSSTPTADFTSYTTLLSALNHGTLDPRFKAVLYDVEDWSLTPANQQSDPGRYYQLAAQLAHRHHLLFLAAPATDLAAVPAVAATGAETATGAEAATPGGGGSYQAFLGDGVIADAARYADVLDIQAQGSEANPAQFTAFVTAAAAQARAANPTVEVLAGISTNPSGGRLTAAAVDRAAQAAGPHVAGFWLNDPAPSAACPRCAGPYPQVALTALRGLGGG